MSLLSVLRLDEYQTPPEDVALGEPVLTWRQRFHVREEAVSQSGFTHSNSWDRFTGRGPYFEWGGSVQWTNWIFGVQLETDLWTGEPDDPRRESKAWAVVGLGPWAYSVQCTWWRNGNPEGEWIRRVNERRATEGQIG